jgi:hypothetical protein
VNRPRREVHIVLRANLQSARRVQDHDLDPTFVEEAIAVAQDLVRTLDLERDGYTLLTIVRARRLAEAACFHLLSGSERGSA